MIHSVSANPSRTIHFDFYFPCIPQFIIVKKTPHIHSYPHTWVYHLHDSVIFIIVLLLGQTLPNWSFTRTRKTNHEHAVLDHQYILCLDYLKHKPFFVVFCLKPSSLAAVRIYLFKILLFFSLISMFGRISEISCLKMGW